MQTVKLKKMKKYHPHMAHILVSSFFPRLFSAVWNRISTILLHMVWPSANLECMPEMWCTRLARNIGCKNDSKNRHLRTIAQIFRAVSSQLRHISIIKKLVKQQYLLHMSPQYGERRSSSGWGRFGSWGHPRQISTGFASWLRYCTDVAQWRSTKLWRSLAVCWGGALYIHFWGLLSRDGILPGAMFTLRPSLAFSYIGSVTARHSSSGRQPN